MGSKKEFIEKMQIQGRTISTAKAGDQELGPLKHLPGTWENKPNLEGNGWNMIALPFAFKDLNYRLLMNRYNETLKFTLVDKGVPNRGIERIQQNVPDPQIFPHHEDTFQDSDQFVVTIDYEQVIHQIAADDFPQSGKAGAPGLAIHHEPGLWLHMLNERTNNFDIARLATIPHGDSVLAVGKSAVHDGPPRIDAINGLPVGYPMPLTDSYMEPYRHFHEKPFQGLFDPVNPHKLLEEANKGVNIVRTTVLEVDSTAETGGIVNLPFIVKQANAASMKSTFWIQEIQEEDGSIKLRLQYAQVVLLDFLAREDGLPGIIRWPHVSINTLEKV